MEGLCRWTRFHLIHRSAKPRNTRANPTETAPAAPSSHSSAKCPRSARAVTISYAPIVNAIATIKSAIVRKATGLVAPRLISSPSALQARPFNITSQVLPFLKLQMPAATVHTPAASTSIPISGTALLPCIKNVRRIKGRSGRSAKRRSP